MIGKIISSYKIIEKLGEGGMGVVYKAEDTKLERLVAIKFLPHHIAANAGERERFRIEAKAAAALNHPNLATIHVIEEIDDEMFIVMELIDGQELGRLLIDNGQLSIDNCLTYAAQIAEGLRAAHNQGISHRDIKSSNIMITREGRAKIMDFGLAKVRGGSGLTQVGKIVGTVAYMSPQQAQGMETDHRTDIWSFGVVLYEMLTGRLPFEGEYDLAVRYAIVNEEPQPVSALRSEVPAWLEYIANKALAKKLEARYSDMQEVLTDLRDRSNSLNSIKPARVPSQETGKQNLPSGTVTFLFTDIEGSTKLAQQYSAAMPALLARHHAILNDAIAAHNGYTFEIVGDSFAVAFHHASDALAAAVEIQRALHRETWSPAPIKVRMGIHTGAAQLQDASKPQRYLGYAALATSSRIMSAGHGGQILLSQTAAELARDKLPTGAQLADMREQRLKDILHPVRLYQLTAPDLPSDFPPLKTAKVVNHNLPAQLTAFIGRETELASLKAMLAEINNRLITIVAPGGMGKTRLSLEAAEQMVEAFPQGIYFVALDRISSAEMIVQAVAEVLPISLSSNEEPKSRIIEYLRDKKILLVMDNFEHVLEGAVFIQEILTAAPRVQILASSRLKLNLTGETVFKIEGLTIREGHLEESSAIQLFASSARRMRPQFELNEAALPAVTKICRLVDGMPLAIVLAAAWIDSLAVDEIADEIEKSIDLLETEKRDMPDRQRSVRAVIDSSWNQVDASAQNLLKRLSVFRGGFTRTAAQEAAGASLRELSQLVDKALLRRDPNTGRYSIHELLRQYAEEQLSFSADEERSAHENHAKYFADFMKARAAHLHDNRSKSALLEIGADIDNLRVAWDYWVNKRHAHRILEFVNGLWFFFEVRGSYNPAIRFFGEAVTKLTAGEPEVDWARAQLQARQAWFTALVGLPEEGLRMAEESLQILRQINTGEISVETLQCANMNAIFLNKVELVAQICQQMLERAQRSGDVWERGLALIWSGWLLFMKSQPKEGLQPAQEALAIFEKLAEPFGKAIVSGVILSAITKAIGDIGASKAYCMRGMKAAEEINYRRLLQRTYDGLGMAALLEHDFQQAQQFFIKSLQISQECGQTREMLSSLLDIVGVYLTQGKLEDALGLIAIVLHHPASDQHSLKRPGLLRDEAEQLRAQIETQLDHALYQSAWESGQRQRLAEVVAQILN